VGVGRTSGRGGGERAPRGGARQKRAGERGGGGGARRGPNPPPPGGAPPLQAQRLPAADRSFYTWRLLHGWLGRVFVVPGLAAPVNEREQRRNCLTPPRPKKRRHHGVSEVAEREAREPEPDDAAGLPPPGIAADHANRVQLRPGSIAPAFHWRHGLRCTTIAVQRTCAPFRHAESGRDRWPRCRPEG